MRRYGDVITELRSAYDKSAPQRDRAEKSAWKIAERAAFLERLRAERKTTLLEIGAGTGQDSAFFQANGIAVVATDLAPGMVARCGAKGLDARVADFLDLPDEKFDAVYAFNALLHVPNADVPSALDAVAKVLHPNGLFFLGNYGGEAFEGVSPDDWHDPPRFFCFRTDDELRQLLQARFEMVDFHVVEPRTDGAVADGSVAAPIHFQSATLRKRGRRR